jgi:hypothetical protein
MQIACEAGRSQFNSAAATTARLSPSPTNTPASPGPSGLATLSFTPPSPRASSRKAFYPTRGSRTDEHSGPTDAGKSRQHACHLFQAGLMFWLRRKKFLGSYFFLIAASRS